MSLWLPIDVVCPYCGAFPGAACVIGGWAGRVRVTHHKARIERAVEKQAEADAADAAKPEVVRIGNVKDLVSNVDVDPATPTPVDDDPTSKVAPWPRSYDAIIARAW